MLTFAVPSVGMLVRSGEPVSVITPLPPDLVIPPAPVEMVSRFADTPRSWTARAVLLRRVRVIRLPLEQRHVGGEWRRVIRRSDSLLRRAEVPSGAAQSVRCGVRGRNELVGYISAGQEGLVDKLHLFARIRCGDRLNRSPVDLNEVARCVGCRENRARDEALDRNVLRRRSRNSDSAARRPEDEDGVAVLDAEHDAVANAVRVGEQRPCGDERKLWVQRSRNASGVRGGTRRFHLLQAGAGGCVEVPVCLDKDVRSARRRAVARRSDVEDARSCRSLHRELSGVRRHVQTAAEAGQVGGRTREGAGVLGRERILLQRPDVFDQVRPPNDHAACERKSARRSGGTIRASPQARYRIERGSRHRLGCAGFAPGRGLNDAPVHRCGCRCVRRCCRSPRSSWPTGPIWCCSGSGGAGRRAERRLLRRPVQRHRRSCPALSVPSRGVLDGRQTDHVLHHRRDARDFLCRVLPLRLPRARPAPSASSPTTWIRRRLESSASARMPMALTFSIATSQAHGTTRQ
jgi:hypothetical protein